MIRFFKRLFIYSSIIVIIIVATSIYNTYKNYNTLIKNITSNESSSSDEYSSYFDHPSLNPSTIVEDDTSSNNLANNYTIEVKDIEISQEIESNSEVIEILSNKSNFNLAVKLNDVGTLVSIDNSSSKICIFKFDGNNFELLKDNTDKYINMNLSDYPTIDSLKDEFINADLFGKYDLFSNILNNSDTNLSESDIISLYFSSIQNKK